MWNDDVKCGEELPQSALSVVRFNVPFLKLCNLCNGNRAKLEKISFLETLLFCPANENKQVVLKELTELERLWYLHFRPWSISQMQSPLPLFLSNQDALQNSTPGVQCSRTLQPLLEPTCPITQRGRERKGIRLMFKSACERECWIQVFVGSVHTGGLSEQSPPVVFQMRLSPYCTPWYMSCIRALKPDCAVMHTSVNVPPYGTMSTTFLYLTSAPLSYRKPAAVPAPGALSDSPWESRGREPVTAKPLRSFIIDSADMRWVEREGQRERERLLVVFSKD